MRYSAITFSLLMACLTTMAQTTTPAQLQLTQVPPQPSCKLIFKTGTCADLWRAYNQALAQRQREELQLYINRQKEIASSQATVPLQQQIADLNKLNADQLEQIKKLQEQMQTDSAAALEKLQEQAQEDSRAKSAAHIQGLWQGAGIGVAAMLILIAVNAGVRRLQRRSV
jgi:hypothetical protein